MGDGTYRLPSWPIAVIAVYADNVLDQQPRGNRCMDFTKEPSSVCRWLQIRMGLSPTGRAKRRDGTPSALSPWKGVRSSAPRKQGMEQQRWRAMACTTDMLVLRTNEIFSFLMHNDTELAAGLLEHCLFYLVNCVDDDNNTRFELHALSLDACKHHRCSYFMSGDEITPKETIKVEVGALHVGLFRGISCSPPPRNMCR